VDDHDLLRSNPTVKLLLSQLRWLVQISLTSSVRSSTTEIQCDKNVSKACDTATNDHLGSCLSADQ
jgi:hypothetical protein